MRFVWKFLLCVAAAWYALRWDCSQSAPVFVSESVCHRLETANWHDQLSHVSPLYRDYVGPELYNRYQWALGHKRQWSGRFVAPMWDKLEQCDTCQRYKSLVQKRYEHYYYGLVYPFVMDNIVKPYQLDVRCQQVTASLQESLVKGSNLVTKIYQDLQPMIKVARTHLIQLVQLLRLQIIQKFELIKNFILEKSADFSSEDSSESPESTIAPTKKPESTVSSSFPSSDYDDDEDELIRTVITSTVIEVITIHSDVTTTVVESTTTPTSTTATNSTNDIDIKSSNDIIIDEQSQLQIEFDNWSQTISEKVDSFIKLFDKEVHKTINKLINTTESDLVNEIDNYSQALDKIFHDITKSIQDIDSIEKIDPNTGEKNHFNKVNSSKIDKFITREMVREFFNKIEDNNKLINDKFTLELNKLMNIVNDKVNYLRQDYSDLYEEWANVMVNEWSKKLVYADIVGGTGIHGDIFNATANDESEDANENVVNRDSQSDLNWKKYLKIKKQVINARDNIIEHNVKLNKVEKIIKKLENDLQKALKENGEFAYILRSKANLAFQQREKEEREAAEREELEAEIAKENAESTMERSSTLDIPLAHIATDESERETATPQETATVEEPSIEEESYKTQDEPEINDEPNDEIEDDEVVIDGTDAIVDEDDIELAAE